MRNRFPGTCYRCGKSVAAGDGHFERHAGGWRTQHASCAIIHRKPKTESAMDKPAAHRSDCLARYGEDIFGDGK